jgi:Fe-S-cluster containining protein
MSFLASTVGGVNVIQSIEELQDRLDKLYIDIKRWCDVCTDKDCVGFVWLLPEEAERLYQEGVPIVEVNNSAFFIHSFPEDGERVIVDQPSPPCALWKSKKCSIYHVRPLVCRLFPIGFATEGKEISVVLHEDCLFVRELGQNLEAFIGKVKRLFSDVDERLLSRLLSAYAAVENISKYPSGSSRYMKIIELSYRVM